MIKPVLTVLGTNALECVVISAQAKLLTTIAPPVTFAKIADAINKDLSTPFSTTTVAQTLAAIYNETLLRYEELNGDDVETLEAIRSALESEGLINLLYSAESHTVPMPNASTELEVSVLPTSQAGHNYSLLVQHLGTVCQTLLHNGHTATITNQSNPANNPAPASYVMNRFPCGDNNRIMNWASVGITFPSDPTGETLLLDFTFKNEDKTTSSTSRTITL